MITKFLTVSPGIRVPLHDDPDIDRQADLVANRHTIAVNDAQVLANNERQPMTVHPQQGNVMVLRGEIPVFPRKVVYPEL